MNHTPPQTPRLELRFVLCLLLLVCLIGVMPSTACAQVTVESCRVTLVDAPDEVLTELMSGDRIIVTATVSGPSKAYVSTRILINGKETFKNVYMRSLDNGRIRSSDSIGIGLGTQSTATFDAEATDSVTIRVVATGNALLYEMQFPVVEGRRAITRPVLPAIQVSNSTPMAATCILLEGRLKDLHATQRRYVAAEQALEQKTTAYLNAQGRLRDDPTELIQTLEALSKRADSYAMARQSFEGARQGLAQARAQLATSEASLEQARAEIYVNKFTFAPASKGDPKAVLASTVIASKENVIDGALTTLDETIDADRRTAIEGAIEKRREEVARIRETIERSTAAHREEVSAYALQIEFRQEDLKRERERLDKLGEHAARDIVNEYRQARTKLAGFEEIARAVGFQHPPSLPAMSSVTRDTGITLAMRAQLLRNLRHAQIAAIEPAASAVREARALALTEQMRLVALSRSVLALKAVGSQQASDAVTKIGHADQDTIVKSLQEMRKELGFYQKFYESMDKNGERGVKVAEFLATDAKGKKWMGDMVGKIRKISGPASKVLDATDKTAKIAELAIVMERGDERDALKAMAAFFDLASSAPGFGGLIDQVMEASKATALKADALVTKVTSSAINRESSLLYNRADAKLYRKNEIQAITNRTVTDELVLAVQLRRLQHLLKQ